MALNKGGILNKIKIYGELIKFEHTVFALPFAYMGAFLAVKGMPLWSDLGWITVAMVGARSSAMGFNRIIDKHIDAQNPRTANRHIPRGIISSKDVFLLSILAVLIFVYAAFKLSPGYTIFTPLIIAVLVGYSYTKRFTWICHYFLGLAIGLAPLASWIAVVDKIEVGGLILWVIVGLWIAGFDIIYATQDYDFDKNNGIHSIPVKFGLKKALFIARLSHVVVVILLISLWFLLDLGWWYLFGVFLTNLLLHYEHSIISADDLSRVNIAFFNINGLISIILFIFTLLDVLL